MEEIVEDIELNEIHKKKDLITHNDILHTHAYEIVELQDSKAVIKISAQKCEKVKESGAIYNGALFSAVSFAAIAAVNEKDFIIINSNIDFLNAIKEDGDIYIFAQIDINGNVKKIVNVHATLNDIEFLRGVISLVKVDESKPHPS